MSMDRQLGLGPRNGGSNPPEPIHQTGVRILLGSLKKVESYKK